MSEHANICPKCGAPAQPFAPEIQSIHCHFCGTPYAVRHPEYEKVRRQKEAEERTRREQERKAEKDKEREEKVKERTKGNAAGCVVPILMVTFIGGIGGGSYWYEDIYKPRQWDGHHDFSCKSGTVTFTDMQATGDVDARGTCVINLVRPTLESHIKVREHAVANITGGRIHDNSGTVISVEGFGKVVLQGTSIEGDEAVRAKGSATVDLTTAIIKGKVRADSPSELIGYTPPAASSGTSSVAPGFADSDRAARERARLTQDLKRFPCIGVTECFQSWDGPFSGKFAVTLDKDGNVKKTTITGTTSPTIKACLTDLSIKKAITTATGGTPPGAGDLVCTYSGKRDGFITQVSTNGSFTPAPK